MAFTYRLEHEDGTPAEPPSLATAVPNWRSGDEIPLGRRTLRVVRIRDDDADRPPVLVVRTSNQFKPELPPNYPRPARSRVGGG